MPGYSLVMKQLRLPLRKSQMPAMQRQPASDPLPEPAEPVMIGGYKVVTTDSGPPDCHQLGWQRFPLHGQVSTEMCCEDLQEEECVLRPQP